VVVTAEEGSVTGSDDGGCVGVVGAADDGASDVGAAEGIVGLESDWRLALGGGFALEGAGAGTEEGTEDGTRDDVLAVPFPELDMTTAGERRKKKKKLARCTQARGGETSR
jgi:hypothetical protein